VRVANDADVAGYGAIKGHGVELVLTLGTGLGKALLFTTTAHLVPGLELSVHPWRKKGMKLRGLPWPPRSRQYGKARWNDFLEAAIKQTEATFNWGTTSYLGGANTKNPLHPGQKLRHRLQRYRPARRRGVVAIRTGELSRLPPLRYEKAQGWGTLRTDLAERNLRLGLECTSMLPGF